MGICDSSNDTKSKDETSKKYPVPVEEPPLIPVVPNYEDDSFFQYKDCKNNSFNKYNNIPLVEEAPLIPVVPNYADDSFVKYKDSKNNSFNKYNNIPVVESPVEIKEKKSFTQTQIIEPHSIRQFINPTNPARNLQTFPVHRLKPPVINRVFEPIYPYHLQNPDFNSFNIDYSNILGKGPFGTVYLGNNKFTNEKVAVKIELKKQNFFDSYILKEIDIYAKLGQHHSIPKIYWMGSTINSNIIIMEILGNSLEKVFSQNNKRFSFSQTISIGIKILETLEYIHNKNIIHRDIKTHCILTKNNDLSQIYITDFGNAKEYISPITGKHIPFTTGNNYIGNYKFTSKNAFLGYEMSRRDDIESLGYLLIYLLRGDLPWNDSNDYNYIKNKKLNISLDDLCWGLPLGIRNFIEYSWNLDFYDKPDYFYLSNLLKNCEESSSTIAVSHNESNSSIIINNKDENFTQVSNFHQESELADSFVETGDRDIIEERYLKNKDSFRFNNILRTVGPFGLDEKDLELFYALNNAINSYKTTENYLVFRYVDNEYLKHVFNFIPYDINYNLSMIRQQIGTIKIEKAFMSCYMTDRHVIEREIKLKVKIPKGINAYITRNEEESEIILPYNTEYKILDANIIQEIIHKRLSYVILIEIIILKKNYIEDESEESYISQRTQPLRHQDFI